MENQDELFVDGSRCSSHEGDRGQDHRMSVVEQDGTRFRHSSGASNSSALFRRFLRYSMGSSQEETAPKADSFWHQVLEGQLGPESSTEEDCTYFKMRQTLVQLLLALTELKRAQGSPELKSLILKCLFGSTKREGWLTTIDTRETVLHCLCRLLSENPAGPDWAMVDRQLVFMVVETFLDQLSPAEVDVLKATDVFGLIPAEVCIGNDDVRCLELMVRTDPEGLKDHCNSLTGLRLIHTAAQSNAIMCATYLANLYPGCVDTLTGNPGQDERSTVIKIIAEADQQGQNEVDDSSWIRSFNDSDMRTVPRTLTFFLSKCSKATLLHPESATIHVLAESGTCSDLELLLDRFKDDPDFVRNLVQCPDSRDFCQLGSSPVYKAIDRNDIKLATMLVELGVDPNRGGGSQARMAQNRGQTPGERAIQLASEPSNVADLIAALVRANAEVCPILEAVMDVGDMTLARAIFDNLDAAGTSAYINHQDSTSGESLLHSCLASYRPSCHGLVEDLVYLLEKGADVTLVRTVQRFDDDEEFEGPGNGIVQARGNIVHKYPVHVAVEVESQQADFGDNYWGKDRCRKYLSAMSVFGISRIYDGLRDDSVRFAFLLEHLPVAAYLADHNAVHEMLHLAYSHWLVGGQAFLCQLVHHCQEDHELEVYRKPLLHWATHHQHVPMMTDVVRAEYKVHRDGHCRAARRTNDLECFRRLEGHNFLKEKAVSTYYDMFLNEDLERHSKARVWISQGFFPTLQELGLVYLMFFLDLFFDIDLALTYRNLADDLDGNGTKFPATAFFNVTHHHGDRDWGLGPGASQRYSKAAAVSFVLILPSIVTFFFHSWSYTDVPKALERALLGRTADPAGRVPGREEGPSRKPTIFRQILSGLVWLSKPFIFPFSHFYRTMRAKVFPFKVLYLTKYYKGKATWDAIKRVEIGIEATGQLIVQMWLLAPFVSSMFGWSPIQFFHHLWSGLGYYVSFTLLEAASFEAQMMAKLLLSSLHVCASITMIRLSKNSCHGLGPPQTVLCFFVSCFAQLAFRTFDLTILFISNLNELDILLSLCGHWILTFALKVAFELPIGPLEHLPRWSEVPAMIRNVLAKTLGLVAATFCSSIVYVAVDRTDCKNYSSHQPQSTFVPAALYFLVMLLEHFVVVGVTMDHSNWSALTATVRYILWTVPVILWLLAAILMVVFYKCLHRSRLIYDMGPVYHRGTRTIRGATLFCFRNRKYAVSVCCCCPGSSRDSRRDLSDHGGFQARAELKSLNFSPNDDVDRINIEMKAINSSTDA